MTKHLAGAKNGTLRVLDVGGGKGWGREVAAVAPNIEYNVIDSNPASNFEGLIQGDICKKTVHLSDGQFDFIFSKDTFEHLLEPWKAAREILRLTKPEGYVLVSAPFSWRYHPSPVDTFRYSHIGLRYLFERNGGFETLYAGYNKHKDIKGFWGNRKDSTIDGSPFTECLNAIIIGRKVPGTRFDESSLDRDSSLDHGGRLS